MLKDWWGWAADLIRDLFIYEIPFEGAAIGWSPSQEFAALDASPPVWDEQAVLRVALDAVEATFLDELDELIARVQRELVSA